jgi:hypothetical protein
MQQRVDQVVELQVAAPLLILQVHMLERVGQMLLQEIMEPSLHCLISQSVFVFVAMLRSFICAECALTILL